MVGDDRQGTAGSSFGRDDAKGLGERARDRHRLDRGQQIGELGMVEPPGPVPPAYAGPSRPSR